MIYKVLIYILMKSLVINWYWLDGWKIIPKFYVKLDASNSILGDYYCLETSEGKHSQQF